MFAKAQWKEKILRSRMRADNSPIYVVDLNLTERVSNMCNSARDSQFLAFTSTQPFSQEGSPFHQIHPISTHKKGVTRIISSYPCRNDSCWRSCKIALWIVDHEFNILDLGWTIWILLFEILVLYTLPITIELRVMASWMRIYSLDAL